jgi:aryl-alcohol dehydrogenase
MRIQAAVTRASHQPASIEELDLDELRDDEILVRVAAAGICHTDIAVRDQTYPVPQPIVLGAGVVERVGRAVLRVSPGHNTPVAEPS